MLEDFPTACRGAFGLGLWIGHLLVGVELRLVMALGAVDATRGVVEAELRLSIMPNGMVAPFSTNNTS